ncbi:MAG: hypothetical protein M9932_04370 [Xanthobacteraceae bacterium]|nr:hypothetical protein [Xanthobacteraceae bacterium]
MFLYNDDLAKEAAKARSDLTMFAAIQALCERSLFSSYSCRAEAEIVRICKIEQANCIKRYDSAIDELRSRT